MHVNTCFKVRNANLKTKTRPVTWIPKADVVIYNLDLKPIGPHESEILTKLKIKKQPFADIFQNVWY